MAIRKSWINYNNGDVLGTCVFLNDFLGIGKCKRQAKFKCSCGNIFVARIDSVKSGEKKSCGCMVSIKKENTNKVLRQEIEHRKLIGPQKMKKLPDLTESDKNRFFNKIAYTANSNCCWEWNGCKNKGGYGLFSVTIGPQRNKLISATRLSYFLHIGIEPLDKCVLHRCDNPICCNPNHLFLGTHKDNTLDMINKGRDYLVGEKNTFSKLDAATVLRIREENELNKDRPKKVLAEKYNVDVTNIYLIIKRKTWKHI